MKIYNLKGGPIFGGLTRLAKEGLVVPSRTIGTILKREGLVRKYLSR